MKISSDQFKSTLSAQHPPTGLSIYLQALWWAGKKNWNKSHEIIQDVPDAGASRIHAYLHRLEGDDSNARYWYARAGSQMPAVSIEKEWEELVTAELNAHR